MLICDENNKTVIIESILTPLFSTHFWSLNLELMDFTLDPIVMLEEHYAPSILVEIERYQFILPASWNILVYDEETTQLDVSEISLASVTDYTILVSGFDDQFVRPATLKTLDYRPRVKSAYPSLNKHQMLCHPIGPDSWVVIAPSDSYGKYLKDKTVGDIF